MARLLIVLVFFTAVAVAIVAYTQVYRTRCEFDWRERNGIAVLSLSKLRASRPFATVEFEGVSLGGASSRGTISLTGLLVYEADGSKIGNTELSVAYRGDYKAVIDVGKTKLVVRNGGAILECAGKRFTVDDGAQLRLVVRRDGTTEQLKPPAGKKPP